MLSIIIPTLNEEKYLPKLIGCLRKQTYNNFEIIVADSASKDNTMKIARKLGCKVVDGGSSIAEARNNGAKKASGKMLMFLDADALIDKGFVARALTIFKQKKLVVASCYLYPLSRNITDKLYFCIFNCFIWLMQFFNPHVAGAFMLTTKEVHNKVRGFDNSIKLFEDLDYVKRCSRYGRFRILPLKVGVSVRRFDSYGRLKVGWTLLSAAFWRLFNGEIREKRFDYKFGKYL